MKLSEIKIEIKNEKQIKVLAVIIILQYWLMYLFDLICFVPPGWLLNNMATVLLCIITTLPAFFAYWKVGIYREKIDFKNKKQYIWILPCLLIFFAGCYIVFGIEADRGYMLFRDYIWLFIYFFFVVAPTEEFIYRVYMLGELSVLLGKLKFLAPVISGTVFGLVHIVNMGYTNASMNILIGIGLGFVKLYGKNCTFISCVLAHGLYDFLITLI